jgi:hypothetical protein
LGVVVFLSACGSDSSDSSRSDFAQDVNDIEYSVRKIEIKSEVTYRDGDTRRISTVLGSPRDLAQEEIRRKTEDGQYLLRVNDEVADININASSSFEHRKERKGFDRCRWLGVTEASGVAAYNKLDVSWVLSAKMDGEDCPVDLEKAYSEFVNSEMGALRLDVLARIRDSGLIDLNESQRVRIEVRVIGDVR